MNPISDPIPAIRAKQLCEHYRSALLDDIVPWWERNVVDRECGGFYSCLERDGRPYSSDKFMWMNARAVWMFSHLYNRLEPRPQWREMAEHGAQFMLKHAYRDDGKMYFRLTREGKPMATALSIYTESFATIALAELGAATENRTYWDRAVQMYDRLMPRFGQPSDTALLGYPINAEFHLHAHDMVRITLAWVMNAIEPSDRWEADLTLSVDSILQRHWKPELRALLGKRRHGRQPDARSARGANGQSRPRHRMRLDAVGNRRASQRRCASRNGLRHHSRLPGTRLGRRIRRHSIYAQYRRFAHAFLGSRHETLVAALRIALCLAAGLEDFGPGRFRPWYEKVHDYTFNHFPDREYGEWYGYLNRDGSPTWTAKATAWKCFFHLPRALLRCYRLLKPEDDA